MKNRRPATLMRTILASGVLGVILCLHTALPAAGGDLQTLWYDKPAGKWHEALPLGNGRLLK